MSETPYNHAEPVPAASQLAVLPFLAAIDGLLRSDGDIPGLRITMHRFMSRQKEGYLQQTCSYLREGRVDPTEVVGRTFAVTTGIIGAAYSSRKIFRTRRFATTDELLAELRKDMTDTNDKKAIDGVAKSYLAIPFVGPDEQVVLILYADCYKLNFFAEDHRIRAIAAMCNGFCSVFDVLQRAPFADLRNFPLHTGEPARSDDTVYPRLQEAVDFVPAPRFEKVRSFNYEAAA